MFAILATTTFGAVVGIASAAKRPAVGSGYGIDELVQPLAVPAQPAAGYGLTSVRGDRL